MPLNSLQVLRQSGVGIACDTPEYLKIRPFDSDAQDATTNPSLVFAAVTKVDYEHLIEDAVRYAVPRRTNRDAQVDLAADFLLVQFGIHILEIIPGRVSVSVDPRLSYDRDAIVTKAHNLISIFEGRGTPRERVLIKIPATYAGILAAQTLEHESPPIHTNATLIFSLVQALACAQAGISVISPFIGRVKDWWAAQAAKEVRDCDHDHHAIGEALSQHPGVRLVRDIRSAYSVHGYKTEVLAAGFRTVEEVVELGRGGPTRGPDMMTLPPELLEALRRQVGAVEHIGSFMGRERDGFNVRKIEVRYVDAEETRQFADAYREDVERERIAMDKVPEGLEKFSVDAKRLEDLLREKIWNFGH